MKSSFYFPNGLKIRVGYDMKQGVSSDFTAQIEQPCSLFVDNSDMQNPLVVIDYNHTPPEEWSKEEVKDELDK